MTFIDVFNGDADGICSLVQLHNANPRRSKLVTGVKRDISLLDRVSAKEGDVVTVLDVSLDKNRVGLNRLLDVGAEVLYIDHHFSGEIPVNKKLNAKINTSSDVCTSLLVNGHLSGAYVEWAIVGAFGDNLQSSAWSTVKKTTLKEVDVIKLECLGTYLNYNGYGATIDDLHFNPETLFSELVGFTHPLDFISSRNDIYNKLEDGYQNDMDLAVNCQPEQIGKNTAVFIMPNEKWARRVSGVYSNSLANDNPDRAHAILTQKSNGNYLVSVRAPMSRKVGADKFCMQFPTGGGRSAAAGINDLAQDQLSRFIDEFEIFYKDVIQ